VLQSEPALELQLELSHPQLRKASRYPCQANPCSNFDCNIQSAFR
jgi:hypothetical protein